MDTVRVRQLTACMFAEYISSYISGEIPKIREICQVSVIKALTGLTHGAVTSGSFKKIIQPVLLEKCRQSLFALTSELDRKLEGFFHSPVYDSLPDKVINRILDYDIDFPLANEFFITERLAYTTERLIDKALDTFVLDRFALSYLGTAADLLYPGRIIMRMYGVDQASTRERHNRLLFKAIGGIVFNVCARMKKSLICHYTGLIHSKVESIEDPCFIYRDAQIITECDLVEQAG